MRRAVIGCACCPRLRGHCLRIARTRKLEFADWDYWGRPVPGFGDPAARLLIIGLAPAAHGGNRTGRVFTGDSSGDWLFEALHRYGFASSPVSVSRDDGLELTDCYVAAAARCAPPDNKPTRDEIANCRPWLQAELTLLRRLTVILVLGRVAFDAYLAAAGHRQAGGHGPRPRFGHAAETRMPDGTTLLCSFHPSRRNTNTGLLTRSMWHGIFRRARALIGQSGSGARSAKTRRTRDPGRRVTAATGIE